MNSGPEEKKYDWQNEIVTGLHVGGAPFYRGQSNYDISQFDVVVLCADNFQYIGYECFFNKKVLMRCPFEDCSRPLTAAEKDLIAKTVEFVAQRVACKRKVLVTCAAGVNRSAMVAGLVMLELFPERTADEVVAQIRKRRKLDYGEALFNESFVKYIKEWRK